ncbi:MAG: phage/plasmid primase, P4 family [Eubacteriales bacterium]
MLEEAKLLIDLGLPIIPICPHDHKGMSSYHTDRCKNPGKKPLIKDWQTRNITTEADFKAWVRQFKNFNIGLPLGEASGYCGIDIDGDVGVDLLMEMSDGDLPSTWEFMTAAGSRLLYKLPHGIKTKKFKQSGAKGAHEECALLCTGQQTVMPPSIHASGAVYTWFEGHDPTSMDCAIAPQWLINAIKVDNDVPVVSKVQVPTPANNSFDFGNEFGLSEEDDTLSALDDGGMAYELPDDVVLPKGKAGKGKKHKIVVTDEMLTQPINEGDRDNTMTSIVGHYCANRDLRRLGKEMIMQICLNHNDTYCNPPLERVAIEDKVNYFYDAETAKDEGYSKAKKDKPQFEASVMVKNVLQYLNNQGILLEYDQITKRYYYTLDDEGPWASTFNYTLINRWIREVLISTHYGDPMFDKRSYIEETRAALEEHFTSPFKTDSDFDLGAHSYKLTKYIVVKAGMVDWQTRKLVPWDPKYKTTLAFNIDFDASAECPRFEKYLEEWLPDVGVRKVIQEYLGYCLIPNTNFRKALFLYGKGRNGKSIFVEFLQDFFGTLSSTLSYDALFQRFGPANLQDKLVNIYDDTNVSFAKDTGVAKNLIAGGQISAEFKGKDHFTFTNIARIIFSAQETPRTSDTTLAWYDRWIFVKFPNTFRASNHMKETMVQSMLEERSGIFNWMLDGLTRLMNQDGFTRSNLLREYTQEYRGLNDNVVQFVNTYCRIVDTADIDSRITCDQLYKMYEMFTEKDNLKCVAKKTFKQRMEDAGFPTKTGKFKGGTHRFFAGVSLDYDSSDLQQYMLELRIILSQGV